MKLVKRLVPIALTVCVAQAALVQPVHAAIVSTEQVARAAAGENSPAREKIAGVLERADVQAQLEKLGVSQDEAKARIAALTDEDAARLAQAIDKAPAGGDGWVVVLAIFVILLITDFLGLTKIFPFTHSMRK